MLTATVLQRKFTFSNKGKELTLTDPDPIMPVADVLNFYANTYPELITAKITGPAYNGDFMNYKFESVMGTKG